jgi:hypothetical protein
MAPAATAAPTQSIGEPTLAVVPDPAPRTPALRLLRYEPDPDGPPAVLGGRPERTPTAPVGLPSPDGAPEIAALRRRAGYVLRLALEVLDGRRPLTHLTPYLDPSALRYVRAALAQRPAARPASRMTSLHASRPSPNAVEVAAVYRLGGRARALAARFEGPVDDGTASANRTADPADWRCVTLRLL